MNKISSFMSVFSLNSECLSPFTMMAGTCSDSESEILKELDSETSNNNF